MYVPRACDMQRVPLTMTMPLIAIGLYFPASQLVQTVEAGPAEYLPASQLSHAALIPAAALYLPASQLSHAVAEAAVDNKYIPAPLVHAPLHHSCNVPAIVDAFAVTLSTFNLTVNKLVSDPRVALMYHVPYAGR